MTQSLYMSVYYSNARDFDTSLQGEPKAVWKEAFRRARSLGGPIHIAYNNSNATIFADGAIPDTPMPTEFPHEAFQVQTLRA